MIQFHKLIINNFLSWGRKQEILLSKQGIVRIEGLNKDESTSDSNMSGKSSIIEALLWCLYGRTIRNIRHDNVINRFSSGGCFVKVQWSIGETNFSCTRYRQHHKYRNRLLLFRSEKLLSFRHGDDTQAKLESILGFDYEAFTNTTIFGGPRPFAILTDAEQKRVLESFLHFEKFETALHSTKRLLIESEEKVHEYDKLRGIEKERISEVRGRLGSLSRATRVGKRKLERERTRIEQRLKKLQKVQHGWDVQLSQIDRVVEVAGEEVSTLEKKLIRVRNRRAELRQRLELLDKSLHDRNKLIGKPCPVCARKIASESVQAFVDHVKQEGRTINSEVKNVTKRKKKLERRLQYEREHLKLLQNKRQHLTDGLHTNKGKIRELQSSQTRLARQAATLFSFEMQSLSKKYSKLSSRLFKIEYQKELLESKIKDLQFWEEGFGNRGVKALIIREALPAMNSKLKQFSQEIFGGSAKISFSASKETKSGKERELFHLRYKSRHGSDSYLGESTGGRKRVDVCVLLVFAWLSRASNILFCDELLDGLDSSGREVILGILKSLRGSVFVISHERELKSHIGKVWTVIKQNGTSHLEAS